MIDWKEKGILGRSGYATVYCAEERASGRIMAVKVMKMSPGYVAGKLASEQEVRAIIQREVSILSRLKHVSLIRSQERKIQQEESLVLQPDSELLLSADRWSSPDGAHTSLEKHRPVH
jgi:serine/threonine protein kinase